MGTVTGHLPCLSESVLVEAVMCASRLSSAGACSVSVSTTPLIPRPNSTSISRSATASLFRISREVWPPGQLRGIGCRVDSPSLRLRRELGLHQCSAAERGSKLESVRHRLQQIFPPKCHKRCVERMGMCSEAIRRYRKCWRVGRLFAWLLHSCWLVIRQYHAFMGRVRLGCMQILLWHL